MYEAHWHLLRRPFEDGAQPEFYYASQTHQTALLKLRYLVDQRKGIGLIAGEHGLGKSFLTHVLERDTRDDGIGPFFRLVFPQLSPAGTLAYFASRLGSSVTAKDSDDVVLLALERQLQAFQAEQKHVVLLIDDAHLLEVPQLHLLRMLLNLREEGRSDFSLILSGRTELLSRLQRVAALDQRVVVRTALEPLHQEEVLPYLRHRLSVAGRSSNIFNEQSARSIWELSQGIPRRINQICDLALLVGYVDELQSIQAVEIEAAAEELMSVAA
ncbi:ExeA family protein [Planctomicrobium sp. SH661]|uniref:ExeA family protein n=1 Tax=Planctomicrobium sp. SH661 TaxID=3448124 RepID=UPI003F5BBF77